MERIALLRERALCNTEFSHEFHYRFYKRYHQLPELAEEERYAESLYTAFSEMTASISDGELIVGKRSEPMSEEAAKEWQETYKKIAETRCIMRSGGQNSHMAVDYDLLLQEGILGIIAKIDRYLQSCTEEQKPFYKCCRRCMEAVIKHAESYSRAAKAMSENTADPQRKKELQTIAQVCSRVPANPADSFYEAVQSVHFLTYCLSLNPLWLDHQLFQLGHPDRYLLPYYEKDIREGTLTKEFAQLLLDCLGFQINMMVPNGLACGYMVGGRDESGNIVANELTQMCMQVIDDVRLVYPSVGLCYVEEMPEKYFSQACTLLAKGYSHPAIFNDEIITKGLMHYGVPEAQARNYIHSTCVEITPVAASNVWVASPYTNMPQLLLDVMDRDYSDFEILLQAFFKRLDASIQENFRIQNNYREIRSKYCLNPLVSCFVNDCLALGLDIERGGAQYNWIMPSFVGIANLVDGLYAIKQLVYEKNRFSLTQFREILNQNFEGNEALRRYILNHIPKYGNDIDEIDRYFELITEHIADECEKYQGMHRNGDLIPSAFCWIMHEKFGRFTQATPDGRNAGFPLGDGSGPCQGRELNGPTASILSSTKWMHHRFIGGVAVNLKFSKALLGEQSENAMKSLVKTYMKRGGFEMQINVVDNDVLKKAQKNPEAYQDLVVRIGGYSDYFVRLSPQMQEELILRTVHHV